MDMLARIAEALEAELGANRLQDGMVEIENKFTDEDMLGIARAVLTTIREPNEAMLAAAPSGHNSDVWKAMIDAALGDSVSENDG